MSFERREHRVDRRVPTVADAVDRLAKAGDEEAAELALAVETGDILVQLALLVAGPAAVGGQPLQDERGAELPAETPAIVGGGGLVVPVGGVALRRVDRLRHRHDFVDFEEVSRRRRQAPLFLQREHIVAIAQDATGLLVACASCDRHDVLAALQAGVVQAEVEARRREVLAGEGAGAGQRAGRRAAHRAAHQHQLVGQRAVQRQAWVGSGNVLAPPREAGGPEARVAAAGAQVRADAVERLIIGGEEVVRAGDEARAAADVQDALRALEEREAEHGRGLLEPEGALPRDDDDVVARTDGEVLRRSVRRRRPGVGGAERQAARRVREDGPHLARAGAADDGDEAARVRAAEGAAVGQRGRGGRLDRAGRLALEGLDGPRAAVARPLVRAPDGDRRGDTGRVLDLLGAQAHRRECSFIVIAERVRLLEDELVQIEIVVLELRGRAGPGHVVRLPDEDHRRADERHAHRLDAVVGPLRAPQLQEVHDGRRLDARLREAADPGIAGG